MGREVAKAITARLVACAAKWLRLHELSRDSRPDTEPRRRVRDVIEGDGVSSSPFFILAVKPIDREFLSMCLRVSVAVEQCQNICVLFDDVLRA